MRFRGLVLEASLAASSVRGSSEKTSPVGLGRALDMLGKGNWTIRCLRLDILGGLRIISGYLIAMKFPQRIIGLFVIGSLTLTSCQTANPYTGESQRAKATTGAALGGLLGAGVGLLSGGDATERRQRALIGAGVGALAGGGIGAYMDKQEAELRRELEGSGVGISRSGNNISLIMPGDITFSTGSSGISGEFYPTLSSVAKVLNKYNQTMVAIVGHTDNVGDRNYNYRLSQSRANSVASFLQTQKVAAQRFQVSGQGPDAPVASNSTAAGRQANRRVSIQLAPMN